MRAGTLCVTFALAPFLAVTSLADPQPPPERGALALPQPIPPPRDAIPSEALLTGEDIYERVLRNRFDSYVQVSSLVSGDRGGSEQESRLRMTWKNHRDEDDRPTRGVLSKTIVKYTEPFDLRFSGYLIINNDERTNDQFLYLASTRRIRRVNLRGEAIFGTDFTFEDVVPRELEDATYRRLPDELAGEIPCYVVEVTPREIADSDYSRLVVYVEKEHYVPIVTRYWDDREVEVKELRAEPVTIREFDGVWVATSATMRNLLLETYTSLDIKELEPNPELTRSTFDLRRLEAH